MNPTAIDTRKGKFLGWNLLPNPEFPIILHSVNHPSNNVVINEREIQVCKFYIDNLMNIEINGRPIDIGVVTPYKEQRIHLQRVLKDHNNLEVSSIDNIVGDQKDVIIFSASKSGPDRTLGILAKSDVSFLFYLNCWVI
jgi:superfamily I DNA and/or RNA helicase